MKCKTCEFDELDSERNADNGDAAYNSTDKIADGYKEASEYQP